MNAKERQLSFYRNTRWDMLNQLLIDAGLLVSVGERGANGRRPSADGFRVNIDRMVALLSLTAIHDLMKIEALLPTVQQKHGPYESFQVGDRINDHDVALSYILQHYSDALPSFTILSEPMQQLIQFTQVRISFNHGWLVQAEAPPGPLFSNFKRALSNGSQIQTHDVHFYFLHWLTDLAGAEPTPLRGSEKFVHKFPHPMLHSFISSFGDVGALVSISETAVFEAFLRKQWEEAKDTLGPPPSDTEAIALMRLCVQVQSVPYQLNVVQSWAQLSAADADVLASEMALTGTP
jgi:hypothetical protein